MMSSWYIKKNLVYEGAIPGGKLIILTIFYLTMLIVTSAPRAIYRLDDADAVHYGEAIIIIVREKRARD